jgi:hypothetical protein
MPFATVTYSIERYQEIGFACPFNNFAVLDSKRRERHEFLVSPLSSLPLPAGCAQHRSWSSLAAETSPTTTTAPLF